MQDVTNQDLKMIILTTQDISISMTAWSIGDYILAFQTHCFKSNLYQILISPQYTLAGDLGTFQTQSD